ncbi:hypothetical protein V8C42DRAFT_319350 [Trichoderma barbatum]
MVQRTFTVVPPAGPAERTPADNRPMTSKQVRKAYRAANRVPRVSRAELLRQERAEQERIRKEFEKEKAASKAKALREKKRAKEQAEREEKKKRGLPLVNVRPSQDTIARFVRGNGSGNKRDCKGQDAATPPALPVVEEAEEDDDDFPSPKRFCNQEQQKENSCEEPGEVVEENASAPEEPNIEVDIAPEKNERIVEDDFLEGFEILSDDEIFKLPFNQVTAKNSVSNTDKLLPIVPDDVPEEEEMPHSHYETTLHTPESPVSVKNPKPTTLQEFDLISDDEDDLEQEMLALDVILTSQQQRSKEPTEEPVAQSQKPARTATSHEMDLGLAANPPNETSRSTCSATHEQARLMPPPPLPAAPQRSRSPTWPIAMKPQAPPLSTQQILFNMDDFFPTSSQQAAELEEEETAFISQPMKSCSIPEPRAPSSVPEKESPSLDAVSSSPEPPKPFFTSSGSNERLAVALLRSRRTAEREEEQRQRALQLEALELEEAKKKEAERRARERRLAEKNLEIQAANYASSTTESLDKGQVPRQTRPVATATPQFSMKRGFVITNPNNTPGKTAMQRKPLVETHANTTLPTAKSLPTTEVNKNEPRLGNLSRQQSTSTTAKIANKILPLEVQNAKQSETPAKGPTKENITSPGISEAKHPMASQESEFGGSWMDELATEFSL